MVCNTYGTPGTRPNVDEFSPVFPHSLLPCVRFMAWPAPMPAILALLFLVICSRSQIISLVSVIRYISSIIISLAYSNNTARGWVPCLSCNGKTLVLVVDSEKGREVDEAADGKETK
jgi:hypothetical protein